MQQPDDAVLLATRDADPTRYLQPARFALTQVFAARERHDDPQAAARALHQRLLAGADPAGLGDLGVHGQRFGERTTAAYRHAGGPARAGRAAPAPARQPGGRPPRDQRPGRPHRAARQRLDSPARLSLRTRFAGSA